MELYIKAGPDGLSVGDCPFAHFVRAVIAFKGLECQVIPCTKDTKPSWLEKDHGGKMPCLKDGEDVVTDSAEIVKYLDKICPEPSFAGGDQVDMLTSKLAGLFPALARFVKRVEFDKELEEKLLAEVETLEEILSQKAAGPYLCGSQLCLTDLSLAPKLYHLKVTLATFSPPTMALVEQQFPQVTKYLGTMLTNPNISSCSYESKTIVWGWGNARKSL